MPQSVDNLTKVSAGFSQQHQ